MNAEEAERDQERRRHRIGVAWCAVGLAVLTTVGGFLWRFRTWWTAAAPAVQIVRVKSDLKKINLAIQMFRLEHEGRLPETLRDLVGGGPAPGSRGAFLDAVPKDPWGRDFVYRRTGDGSGYDLFCLGADGVEGGTEENADIRVPQE